MGRRPAAIEPAAVRLTGEDVSRARVSFLTQHVTLTAGPRLNCSATCKYIEVSVKFFSLFTLSCGIL